MKQPALEWEDYSDPDFPEEIQNDVPPHPDADVACLLELEPTDITRCEARQAVGLLSPDEVAFRILRRLQRDAEALAQGVEVAPVWLLPIERLHLPPAAYQQVAHLVRTHHKAS